MDLAELFINGTTIYFPLKCQLSYIDPEKAIKFLFLFRKTFKSDYEALKDRLTTLPDKVTHDVTVKKILKILKFFGK